MMKGHSMMRSLFLHAMALMVLLPGCGKERDPAEKEAFFEAVFGGDVAKVRAALQNDGSWSEERVSWSSGMTPLHVAAWQGMEEMAVMLLDEGADVDPRDDLKRTPLHLASEFDHTKIASMLLAKGADTEVTDIAFQYTPLQMAAMLEKKKTAELLIASGARVDIYSASGLDMTDRLEELLKRSPQLVNAKDNAPPSLGGLQWMREGSEAPAGQRRRCHSKKRVRGRYAIA